MQDGITTYSDHQHLSLPSVCRRYTQRGYFTVSGGRRAPQQRRTDGLYVPGQLDPVAGDGGPAATTAVAPPPPPAAERTPFVSVTPPWDRERDSSVGVSEIHRPGTESGTAHHTLREFLYRIYNYKQLRRYKVLGCICVPAESTPLSVYVSTVLGCICEPAESTPCRCMGVPCWAVSVSRQSRLPSVGVWEYRAGLYL